MTGKTDNLFLSCFLIGSLRSLTSVMLASHQIFHLEGKLHFNLSQVIFSGRVRQNMVGWSLKQKQLVQKQVYPAYNYMACGETRGSWSACLDVNIQSPERLPLPPSLLLGEARTIHYLITSLSRNLYLSQHLYSYIQINKALYININKHLYI